MDVARPQHLLLAAFVEDLERISTRRLQIAIAHLSCINVGGDKGFVYELVNEVQDRFARHDLIRADHLRSLRRPPTGENRQPAEQLAFLLGEQAETPMQGGLKRRLTGWSSAKSAAQ